MTTAAPNPKSGYAARTLPNIVAVARREVLARIRTRAYRFTTVILVLAGIALALAPTIIQLVDRGSTGDRIEVVAGGALPGVDAAAALQQLLNATAGAGPPVPIGHDDAAPRLTVVAAPDVETARSHVIDGTATAALALTRAPSGDLAFDLYSNDGAISRTNQLLRQAVGSITIQDRLTRAGVSPIDQATLFTPPDFELLPADPTDAGRPDPANDPGAFLTGFGLSIAIFMAIILYGTWIAYGVAEEKSSRVMEIVLAAATPFQLLAGKVIGIGALALLQYVIVALPMILVLAFQSQISSLILGTPAAAPGGPSLVSGISIGMVLTFGVMLVLGFAVYASLYAGAASLVSRQEDINQIVAPLTFISVGGYLVSTYAGTGLIPLDSPLVVVLSYVPLFSPYLMLTRLSTGTAEPLEVVVAIVLLALTVPVALWVAARLYRSGVLMYGQSPSPRTLWKALRAR
jgi:ABC-2 type transport system permease protein